MERLGMNIQFISAGAGSGKTFKLTELISMEIASGISPDRILATTFTVKAAGEIQGRVRKWFIDKKDYEGAGKAGAVHIGTVNSVCGQIVSDFAFEAGLSPDLKVCEASEASAILARVIGRDIDPAVIEEFDTLERRFGIEARISARKSAGKKKSKKGESKWKDHLEEIIKQARSYNIDPATFPAMAERNAADMLACIGTELVDCDDRVTSIIEDALPEMEAEQREKPYDTTADYIEACRDLIAAIKNGNDSWDKWVKCEKARPAKSNKKSIELADDISLEVAAWRTHPRFHRDVRRYLALLFETAAEALRLYAEEKERTGKIDFTDQEVKLHELLQRDDIRSRLAERIEIVFVDEFQDTSPIQLAIFLALAGIAKKTYWIGDVKQAIYGFRGSDSTLMEKILSALGQGTSSAISLEHSWRSRPALVNLCNDIFSDAFAGELTRDSVCLKAKRKEINGPYFARWNLEGKKDDQASAIAVGLRNLIESGLQVVDPDTGKSRPVEWKDIAILSFYNETCDILRSECRKAGIPLRSSGTGLLSTPEGRLVTACLRRLNDREDTLASAEIIGLSAGDAPTDWLTDRIKMVEAKDYEANASWKCVGTDANPVLAELEKIRPLASILSLSALLDTMIVRCHLENYLIGWTPSVDRARERMQNLEAYRSLVAQYEDESSGKAVSLACLLLWLGEQAATTLDKLPPSVIEGITVATWHGSKGLEWPVVILHQTAKEIRTGIWNSVTALTPEEFDLKNPLAGSQLRLWPWPWGAQGIVSGIDYSRNPVCATIEKKAKGEEKRLLYVGCTRARDYLAITQSAKGPGNSQVVPGYECLGATAQARFLGAPVVETFSPDNGIPGGPDDSGNPPNVSPLHWFTHTARTATFPEAAIIPSATEGTATAPPTVSVLRQIRYGVAVPAIEKAMIREEGTRFHAAFAFFANNADFSGATNFPREWRDSIMACVRALKELFPDGRLHTELSVLADAGKGRYIDARLDLVVETDEALYIVDHKLSESAGDDVVSLASRYATQLALYRQALKAKTGKPVLGLWLNMPMEGLLAEVGCS